jgi:hypothetical protein
MRPPRPGIIPITMPRRIPSIMIGKIGQENKEISP